MMPLTKLELLAIYTYQPELFPAALEQAANDYDRYMLALVTTKVHYHDPSTVQVVD